LITLDNALKPREKFLVRGAKIPLLVALLAGTGLGLSGCISSTAPVLSGAMPVLGDRGQLHLFSLSDGAAHDPSTATFEWTGSRYTVHGKSIGVTDFTALPFEGRDLIVQGRNIRPPHAIEYALARRLADGTYLVVPIDENDVDEPTRAKFCTKAPGIACGISTPEQLLVLARATADKDMEGGGLAVVVPAEAKR
jgi:hypothetical protein